MTQVFSNPIILAIDTNSENEAFDLVNELKENIGAVKLGLEYFHSYGPEGVRKIKNLFKQIMDKNRQDKLLFRTIFYYAHFILTFRTRKSISAALRILTKG